MLGLAGALAEGLFRNPLADPYLLGSAAGAGLGVVLTIFAGSQAGVSIGLANVGWLMQIGLVGAAFWFPAGALPGNVAPQIVAKLALVYAPTVLVLYGVALVLMFGYKITRDSHQETLRKLAADAEAVAEGIV